MKFLDKINNPLRLKRLPRSDLPILADEIRKVIIDTVSKNGGHLASSLGAVELAIATQYVFNTPEDKIIWDVGHQAYAHKILTGRSEQFHTLRQYNGLSGFTRISESPYDALTTGHCSTSISAGLGMACANPDRFFDVGIAEQHAVTFAAGLAAEGFKPVVAIYSTFLQRAYDQILHDVCLEALPVVFAVDRSGIVGEDGPTHQGLFDLSYLRCLPNMVVMAPKDENELGHMLKTAIDHKGPIAIRYPRGTALGVDIEEKLQCLPIGKAEILQNGDDILILAIGRLVGEALTAHLRLLELGIFATVVNCRFIKPLDAELIGSLAGKIPHIITVEENVRQGGFGSAVLECLYEEGITGFRIERVGITDTFVEHGPQNFLRSKYGVDASAIVNAAVKLFKEDSRRASRLNSIDEFSLKSLSLS